MSTRNPNKKPMQVRMAKCQISFRGKKTDGTRPIYKQGVRYDVNGLSEHTIAAYFWEPDSGKGPDGIQTRNQSDPNGGKK